MDTGLENLQEEKDFADAWMFCRNMSSTSRLHVNSFSEMNLLKIKLVQIQRDKLGGERDSQAPDEQGCFHSTFELYRDLENEAGREMKTK